MSNQEDLIEKSKCPVCFEIPGNEVYQCTDGHTVCHQCYENLATCPQCRVIFGDKIRNRALECLLDSLELECRNKEFGCEVKLHRKDVAEHKESCSFRQTIQLCHQLGLKCSFEIEKSNLARTIDHFKESHEYVKSLGSSVFIHFKNLVSPKEFRHNQNRWTPVMIKVGDSNNLYIILGQVIKDDRFFSVSCIHLSEKEGKGSVAHFKICCLSEKVSDIVWSVPPTEYLNWDSFSLMNLHPIRIPVASLLQHFVKEERLTLELVVGEDAVPANFDYIGGISIAVDRIPDKNVETSKNAKSPKMGFKCWECHSDILRESLFKCMQCKYFGMCGDCKKKGAHAHHVFMVVDNNAHFELTTSAEFKRRTRFLRTPGAREMEPGDFDGLALDYHSYSFV